MASPVVNITNSPGLTNVSTADSTTGWSGFNDGGGGTPSPVLEQDIFIQGSAAISTKISGSGQNKGLWFDTTTGVDMTVSGRHMYIWIAVTTIGILNTISNGGIYVKVASDASGANWNKYFVGGSDFTVDAGFVRYVIDLTKTPSETAGTPATLTSIRWFGAGLKSTGTAKAENLVIDRIDYGDGLQIEDGDSSDPATWESLFQADDNSSNKYGIVEKRSGVYFLKGAIAIGDASSSATTLWNDTSGAQVVFEDPLYHNGVSLVSSIDSTNLYKIDVVGNATGTTDVSFGQVVGSGDSRQGLNGGSISSAGPKWSLDAETDIADLDTVNMYGVSFQGAGDTQFSSSTKTDVIGCSFTECGEVQPNDAEFLNNSIISPTYRGMEILSSHNAKNVVFVSGSVTGVFDRVWAFDASTSTFSDQTSAANSATTGDWTFFGSPASISDYFAVGSQKQFNKITIDVGTAGTGGATIYVIYEYWNGSSWVAFEQHIDNTDSLKNSGVNDVLFDVPKNWVPTSLGDSLPLYYVRGRILNNYTTDPIGDEGSLSFSARMTRIPSAASLTYNKLQFFGTTGFHVENSVDSTTADSYPNTNRGSSPTTIGNGTTDGAGQSFTGNGGTLLSTRLMLVKVGSPTGNIVSKVYAHSGTFGTSSIPTGTALATSNAIDVSTLPIVFSPAGLSLIANNFVDFEFTDELVLVNGTKYVVTVEYSAGDGSNNVLVANDATSPTHGGNFSTLASSTWTPVSGTDMIFYVGTGTLVEVNGINGSNPSTKVNTGSLSGATAISVPVPIEINGVTDGAQCSIVATSGGPETPGTVLMNKAANTSGIASSTYNFGSSQPVVARARSGGIVAAAIADDGGVLTDETLIARDRSTTNDVTIFPTSPVVSTDQYYVAGLTTFDELLFRIGTTGVGTYVLTWEYWNGSWSTLTTIQADDFKSTGPNFIRFSKPGDWVANTVNSQGPYFYLRVRWTSGTMTTSPIGDNISASVVRYLPFSQDRVIDSSGLTVVATWVEDKTAGSLG